MVGGDFARHAGAALAGGEDCAMAIGWLAGSLAGHSTTALAMPRTPRTSARQHAQAAEGHQHIVPLARRVGTVDEQVVQLVQAGELQA